MPIPLIASINPSSGSTSGSLLVEVLGAGFQLAALPQATKTTQPPSPTVAVFVGGRAARDVRVFSGDRLTCIVPAGDAGPVDLVIQNLDAAGAPIQGQEATAPGAFTYVPQLLAVEADLTRLVRTLLQELKR